MRIRSLTPTPRTVTLAAAAFLSLSTPTATAQQAPEWTVDHEASRVGFVAQQSGNPVPGEFENVQATIRFDRDALDASSVDVRIDVASVATGSMDRDQTIKSPSLFHAEQYPNARFQADSFRHEGGDRYIAEGELTMRGTTHPIELPFSLETTQQGDRLQAVADGEVTVKRLRWGIGQGQWQDTSMVPNEVVIEIELHAARPAG
jgi:polyisoprenoid-binding protein YceI